MQKTEAQMMDPKLHFENIEQNNRHKKYEPQDDVVIMKEASEFLSTTHKSIDIDINKEDDNMEINTFTEKCDIEENKKRKISNEVEEWDKADMEYLGFDIKNHNDNEEHFQNQEHLSMLEVMLEEQFWNLSYDDDTLSTTDDQNQVETFREKCSLNSTNKKNDIYCRIMINFTNINPKSTRPSRILPSLGLIFITNNLINSSI